MDPVQSPASGSSASSDHFAFQVLHESAYQETLEAYEENLWSNLRTRLNRAEFFLLPGRIDLALKYLQKARDFCAEYNATPAMYRKCQDTEDVIQGWRRNGSAGQRVRLKRRNSDSFLQSPVNRVFSPQYSKTEPDSGAQRSPGTNRVGSYRQEGAERVSQRRSGTNGVGSYGEEDIERVAQRTPGTNGVGVYGEEGIDTETVSKHPFGSNSVGPHNEDTTKAVSQRFRRSNTVGSYDGVGIKPASTSESDDALYDQLRAEVTRPRDYGPELSPINCPISAPDMQDDPKPMKIDAVLRLIRDKPRRPRHEASDQLVLWERQLLKFPTQFKPSEQASPRRHSTPQDSPNLPAFANMNRARRGSIHPIPEPLSHHELDAPAQRLNPTEMPLDASVSSYSRRHSHDDTRPVLFSTPSLEKLNMSLAGKPHKTADSRIASRIRRLSTEDPSRVPLPQSPASSRQHSDFPPTSPLSQSFTPDDFPMMPPPMVMPTVPAGQSRNAPASLLLGTISPSPKPSSGLDTSPQNPSPLREYFTPPVEPAMTDADESDPSPQTRQPTRSLIPVLVRTCIAQANTGRSSADHADDDEQPTPADVDIPAEKSTSTSKPQKSSWSNSTFVSARARQVSWADKQETISPSQSPLSKSTSVRPKARRKSTETRVLSIAAGYDAETPPTQGIVRANTSPGQRQDRFIATKPVMNKNRPRWQGPGKAPATTGMSG